MNNEKIKYLYDVNDNIANNHTEYFDPSCNYNSSPYIEILTLDFLSPIQYWVKIHGDEYYENIIKDAQQNKNMLLKSDTTNKNKIAIEYIKNKTNSNLILLHVDKCNDLINYLKQIGIISITKKVKLSKNALLNLLCDIHIEQVLKYNTVEKRLQFLNNKGSYINIKNDNDIYCIVFELDDYNINEIKTNINKIVGEGNMELISNRAKCIEISSLIFDKESICSLDRRILKNWIHEDFIKTFMKLNAIYKWVNKNIPNKDRDSFMLLDEGFISTLGVRNAHKFSYILNNDELNSELPFMKFDKDFLLNATKDLIYVNYSFYYYKNIKICNINESFNIKYFRYNLTDYIDFVAMLRIHDINRTIYLQNDDLVRDSKHTVNELISRFLKYDRILLHTLLNEFIE